MLPRMTAVAPSLSRPALNMPVLGMSVAAAASLALAVRAPIALTLVGFVLFGAWHNLLELRYVLGRFADLLSGRFLGVLVGLITGIAVCRLVAGPTGRTLEIGLGYLVLGVAAFWSLRRNLIALAAVLAVLAAATALSLTHPAHHFVVLTHLHNLVPLAFIWEWARHSPALRAVSVGWVLVIPAGLLLGLGDGLVRIDAATRFSPAASPLFDGVMATRFLAVFAFLQSMHYVVWVWLLPRYAPAATARFEQRIPGLRGWRIWVLGALAAAALGVVLWADYSSGRGIYASLAGYHAYLEFPVLLAMLMSLRKGQS
jgi:hypothetical protein